MPSYLDSPPILWTPQIVSLGLVQMQMTNDVTNNLTRALDSIATCVSQGAQIVCLPELFRSPYFPGVPQDTSALSRWSEPLSGETLSSLCSIAKEKNIVIVGGSIFEKSDDGLFNTSVVVGPKGLIGKYRKTHIPHDPSFYERDYFQEGDSHYPVFSTPFGTIGVLICYDQWFPEAARSLALQGAEIIFYPTAIATSSSMGEVEGSWQAAWEGAQRGHAICNNTIVATINRVGREGDLQFWGGSFVYDAFGTCLVHGGDSEETLVTRVDIGHSRYCREAWRFFPSRRPSTYSLLTKELP
jgi:predicted amidohydrolase